MKVEPVIKRKVFLAILEMKPFEDDLFNFIENIKFRNARNEFQEYLANDLRKLTRLPTILFSQIKLEAFMKYRSTHNMTSLCTTTYNRNI